MITLEDIARKAGVSHSTVSRALADSPLVNPETKERIQALAREAGYQVNQVARNLKVRSTRTIGLVVPEVSNPYYPKLIQKIADEVRAAGYSLQLHLSGAEQDAEASCLASLREHRADGILLVSAEHGVVAREQVDALVRSGTPLILMGWVDGFDHLDIVSGDDASGGFALARHLIELGHARVAVIGKSPHRGAFDRMFGFEKAFRDAGLGIDPSMQIRASDDQMVKEGVRQLLQMPEPPTAIFAYQDSLAALVMKHLVDAGVSIPSDMSVVGFDDLDLAQVVSPRLTTVGLHVEPLAEEFVRLLLRRIRKESETEGPEHIIVTPRLVVRASSAQPRTEPLQLERAL